MKQVAWLRIASVCVGCDCTTEKSNIYFYINLYLYPSGGRASNTQLQLVYERKN
jgi:hypothetical protein